MAEPKASTCEIPKHGPWFGREITASSPVTGSRGNRRGRGNCRQNPRYSPAKLPGMTPRRRQPPHRFSCGVGTYIMSMIIRQTIYSRKNQIGKVKSFVSRDISLLSLSTFHHCLLGNEKWPSAFFHRSSKSQAVSLSETQ